MHPERDGAPTPWVLAGLANPEPLTWVLDLNEGVTFQNGTPLDGAALAALLTFQLAENPDFAAGLPGATAVATGPLQGQVDDVAAGAERARACWPTSRWCPSTTWRPTRPTARRARRRPI